MIFRSAIAGPASGCVGCGTHRSWDPTVRDLRRIGQIETWHGPDGAVLTVQLDAITLEDAQRTTFNFTVQLNGEELDCFTRWNTPSQCGPFSINFIPTFDVTLLRARVEVIE